MNAVPRGSLYVKTPYKVKRSIVYDEAESGHRQLNAPLKDF
jgi:hypothetical protein